MKQITKRGLALILALILSISVFSGMTFTASAATYVANWGERGVLATELTSYAIAFYTGTNEYEDFALLSGSSTVSAVPQSALYKALQSFMRSKHAHQTSYAETRYLYQYTDCQWGQTTKPISCFYSGIDIGPEWDAGDTWNREHTWPQSKGSNKDDPEGGDIIALRPTEKGINSSRGNKPFGESSGYYLPTAKLQTAQGTVSLDMRGDVARVVLYTYVRWGNSQHLANLFGASGVIESLDVMLSWNEEDPVDTWELGRNDSVQSITGTRNVFVDYPELMYLLFNEEIPETLKSPSNGGEGVDDTPIDVTLTIKQTGAESISMTVPKGTQITLPEYTGVTPAGTTFLGFTDVRLDAETKNKPANIYSAGHKLTLRADTILYALYSRLGTTTDTMTVWELVTDASSLKSGDEIVIAGSAGNAVAGSISSGKTYLESIPAEFSSDKKTIYKLPDGAVPFTLGGSSGAWTFTSANGKLGVADVKKVAWNSGKYNFSITIETDGRAHIRSEQSSYGRLMCNVSAPRFTTYTSNPSIYVALPELYRKTVAHGGEVTTYFTASDTSHTHAFNKEIAAEGFLASPASCTAKAKYYLSCECGEKSTNTFEYGESLPHTYDRQIATNKYLAADATCVKANTYYYSCECGEKGTTTFESGETTSHSFGNWEDDGATHVRRCQIVGCTAYEEGKHAFTMGTCLICDGVDESYNRPADTPATPDDEVDFIPYTIIAAVVIAGVLVVVVIISKKKKK